MQLKLTVKIPAIKEFVSKKVTNAFAKSLKLAQQRVVPLVVERASALVEKAAPDMAKRYEKALKAPGAVQVTDKGVTIEVKDPVVVAFENGAKAWDMKQKLLAHAKASKGGGMYVDVPFTHKAGSIPSSARKAMSSASKATGGLAAIRLSQNTPGKSGTRLLNRGRLAQALGVKPKKQKFQHKRGLHDDLVRKSTGPRSASYTTIRRISTNSPASAWMHPGFKAHHLLDKVLPSLKREISEAIRESFATMRNS